MRRLADVDWEGWDPEIRATLLFVVRDGEILLIRKKPTLMHWKMPATISMTTSPWPLL